MEKICAERTCVALAVKDGLCSPHAAGYKRHDNTADLHCATCRNSIRKDEWYQRVDASVLHVKSCKVHPEVAKERAKAADAAKAAASVPA